MRVNPPMRVIVIGRATMSLHAVIVASCSVSCSPHCMQSSWHPAVCRAHHTACSHRGILQCVVLTTLHAVIVASCSVSSSPHCLCSVRSVSTLGRLFMIMPLAIRWQHSSAAGLCGTKLGA